LASAELIDWVRLGIISVGATLALFTYKSSQRQKKLENSLKLLELFHNNLNADDINNWKKIYQSSSESTGCKKGYYLASYNEQEVPLNHLFSEGADDQGSTARITEQIELICYEALQGNVELRIVYSNVGQLMDVIYRWYNSELFFKSAFPYFNKVMHKKVKYLSTLPKKTFAYCE
jgi:hypothetical protein